MADTRPLFWVGSSRRDLKEFPDEVQQIVGFALHQAQLGDEHVSVKALRGFGGRGVLEVIERHDGDTYRAAYTVRFETGVYVLHCFQKKAKQGAQTPKTEMDLIRKRLRDAEDDDAKASGGK